MILLAALLASAAAVADPPLLHPLFTDHAVLQRDRPIEVWGAARPGEEVQVHLGSETVTTRADTAGRWTARMPALPAGGPHELVALTPAGRRQTVRDVQVGDVWLCSGQSNMAWPVSRTLSANVEIGNSANDLIRAVTVPQKADPMPADTFAAPLEWKVAGPSTTGGFSAACYYFARELQKTVRVPMGLVISAWGGSKIQPWLSAKALRALGQDRPLLDVLDAYRTDPAAGAARFGLLWQDWWTAGAGRDAVNPWATDARGPWRDAPAELGFWENWGVPELATYDGVVLYRTSVTLTAEQAQRPATLSIGPVDEIDVTWLNGRAIGSRSGGARAYRIPAGVLRTGENVIVVSALDTYLTGGIHGPADARAVLFDDGTSVPLAGPWRYQVAPADIGRPPRAPWESTAGLGTIANAMIAPLGHFGFRGALWYQGESNAYVPEGQAYESQMRALMADWRERFGPELAFLIVQLANYGAVPTAPVESGWALVREGQRRAAKSDSRAGLAVAIDVGEPYELHPANKQEVGRRLARAARRVVYGEHITLGPQPASAWREASGVVVAFDEVEAGLVARSGKAPTAFELCGRGDGSCRYVDARIDGDRVLLDAAGRNDDARVRYCWADAPICTLTDRSGLPVSPFQLDVVDDR
jgi:sialate O-acetylesterase